MFDAVRNNKRIVQGFLILITLPFALWGVDSYVRNGQSGQEIAKVGDASVSQAYFQRKLQEEINALRNRTGREIDPKLFNDPALRQRILDGVINQMLLSQEASRLRLAISDLGLRQVIASIPAFQENGRFSKARYEAVVASEGKSVEAFEADLRFDLTLRTLLGSVAESGFVPKQISEQVLAVQTEVRQIQEQVFSAEQYRSQVKLDADAAKAYYDANSANYQIPEQVSVQYVALTPDAIAAQIKVTEGELRAAYEANKSAYQNPEQRRASHILITAEGADLAKVKAQAEKVLEEVRAKTKPFAEIAKKYSEDPGSAKQGGDLGYFAKGMMVQAFEEAVWSLKQGEISGLVQSDFGFHIIQLTGIKGGDVKPFEHVRAGLEKEVKAQAVTRKFAEAAETFGNMVYEESDSLKGVADKFHLTIQQSPLFAKAAAPVNSPLGHPRLLNEIFGADALNNRRNTQAVDVAPNVLVSARVVEHKPATMQSFESVRSKIEDRLKQEAAFKLAQAAAEASLAALKSGQDSANTGWGASREVTRMNAKGLPPTAMAPVFRLPAQALPAYTKVDFPGDRVVVYKLNAVRAGVPEQRDRVLAAIEQQLRDLWVQEDVKTYLAALRERYKVKVDHAALMADVEK